MQKHLSQTDAKKCWGKSISDVWSMDKVKEESGVSSVKSVKVYYSKSGYVDKVSIETNKGKLEFDGANFKDIFNLRVEDC